MKVHLSAIAGTAMASLAGLLRERGHEVTGSDQDIYPPMSTQLEELGIPVRSPYAEENVPADAELVVIGNALSRGNPEVEIVLDRKQRMASLPQVLAEEVIRGHESLVVAGTHGKTTTTSMLAFLLDQAGLDPSFLIGGVPVDFARSYRIGRGKHFVVEGDEYDSAFFDKGSKFFHYRPQTAILSSVELDPALLQFVGNAAGRRIIRNCCAVVSLKLRPTLSRTWRVPASPSSVFRITGARPAANPIITIVVVLRPKMTRKSGYMSTIGAAANAPTQDSVARRTRRYR